ncbi:hypothetical protein [uncultured Shewanella sp.]|uniref:hypothetical protein n=1 Tax=uncultured Shewanella sp. TaxID=173975 RepID=UPI00262314B3|nr:hypothetical protein [uncultured Shewanella sp.]
MKQRRIIFLTFLSLILSACGGSDDSPPPAEEPSKEPPEIVEPVPEIPQQHFKPQVDDWLTDKITQLNALNCEIDNNDEACEQVSLTFSDGEFLQEKSDPNQTILILDYGLEFSATVRYRSRVKAIFKQADTGYYQQNDWGDYNPAFELPAFVVDTLKAIDNFTDEDKQARFIPAAWLTPLYTVFDEIYPYSNYQEFSGHGVKPFTYLLEHNPLAEFVIAPQPQFFKHKTDLFCYPSQIEDGQTSTNLQRLNEYITDVSADFKENVLDKQSVEYINYSGGYTLASIESLWASYCSTPQPSMEEKKALLNAVRPFYEVLFNSQSIFGFQASDVNMTLDNNALDIDKAYINRILVGDFASLDSKLPNTGMINDIAAPALEPNRDNSKQWIDIFVNFGITPIRPFPYNNTPLMETDMLGLDSYPITSMQPSWASPVALSRAIHIKNTEFPERLLDNLVIEQIKEKMTPQTCNYSDWAFSDYEGKCKMQDPLFWRQHEVYRLDYLD